MSAFIVPDSTINRILTHLSHARNIEHIHWHLRDTHGYDLKKKSHLQAFGQALTILNRRAVNARYRETDPTEAFTLRVELSNLPAVVKAVSCLKYQCCEGTIPNEPLYKTLEYLEGQLALSFVQQSPNYEVASWG